MSIYVIIDNLTYNLDLCLTQNLFTLSSNHEWLNDHRSQAITTVDQKF